MQTIIFNKLTLIFILIFYYIKLIFHTTNSHYKSFLIDMFIRSLPSYILQNATYSPSSILYLVKCVCHSFVQLFKQLALFCNQDKIICNYSYYFEIFHFYLLNCFARFFGKIV